MLSGAADGRGQPHKPAARSVRFPFVPFGVLRGESAGRGSAGQGAVLGSQRGFCLWATRLEAVAVHSRLVEGDPRETDWTGLKLLLEGIAPRRIQRR